MPAYRATASFMRYNVKYTLVISMSDYTERFTVMRRSPTSRPNEIGGVWAIGYDSDGKYFGLLVNARYALLQRVPGAYVFENTFTVKDWHTDGTDLCLALLAEDGEMSLDVRMGAHALELQATLLPPAPERRKPIAITDDTGALIGYYGVDNKPRLFERMGYRDWRKPIIIPEKERALVIPRSKLLSTKTDADGVILEIA